MERTEFISKLRQALSDELTCHVVDENVQYYEDYITMEIKKGKLESEVLQQLGDPRLIAKSIIETNKADGRVEQRADQGREYTAEDGERKQETVKAYRFPGWLAVILVLLVVFGVLSIAASLFFTFLPYLLIIMGITFVVRLFKRK